jgi:hypothetical protein
MNQNAYSCSVVKSVLLPYLRKCTVNTKMLVFMTITKYLNGLESALFEVEGKNVCKFASFYIFQHIFFLQLYVDWEIRKIFCVF